MILHVFYRTPTKTSPRKEGDHSFFIALKFIAPQFLPPLVCRASPLEFKRVPLFLVHTNSWRPFSSHCFIPFFIAITSYVSLFSSSSSSNAHFILFCLFSCFRYWIFHIFISATLSSCPWKKKHLQYSRISESFFFFFFLVPLHLATSHFHFCFIVTILFQCLVSWFFWYFILLCYCYECFSRSSPVESLNCSFFLCRRITMFISFLFRN